MLKRTQNPILYENLIIIHKYIFSTYFENHAKNRYIINCYKLLYLYNSNINASKKKIDLLFRANRIRINFENNFTKKYNELRRSPHLLDYQPMCIILRI